MPGWLGRLGLYREFVLSQMIEPAVERSGVMKQRERMN